MEIIKKHINLVALVLFGLSLASGWIFYVTIVGQSGTNIFSVLFGWQWIYLAAASIALLIYGLIKKNRSIIRRTLFMLAILGVLLGSAQAVYSSRFYITGDGGPAGPDFSCLVWNNSEISGAYDDKFGWCASMSIPSFNKFLFDRSRNADQSDSSVTYYISLVINETILIGSFLVATRKKYTGVEE